MESTDGITGTKKYEYGTQVQYVLTDQLVVSPEEQITSPICNHALCRETKKFS